MNARTPVQVAAVAGAAGASRPMLQRQCACGTHTPSGDGECAACARKRVRRKAFTQGGEFDAPPIVQAVLQGAGRPLDAATRAALEPRFGHDFSTVRVHTDAHAAESARAVGAHAYTVGRQIVFGAGQYRPGSRAGQRLLAHELTHTIQQGAFGGHTLSPKLAVGTTDSAAEAEADRVAGRVTAGLAAPAVRATPHALLQRQADPGAGAEPDFTSPQQRGGRPRSGSLDAGRRGPDEVRVAVTRYLCDCVGRPVTRTRVSTRVQPGPGVTLEICRGRVTARISGDVVPSSISTGRATARGEVNVATGGGTGVRVGVEGEARNTGSEPQVGVRTDLRVKPPRGPQVGVGGEILRGTESGQIDTSINVGVDVNVPGIGPVRIGAGVTNPQDERRGGQITLGGNLPGQDVQDKTCRECRCPAVYECLENIPPRDYEVPVTHEVDDRSRLRYYYSLDSNQDTRDAVLRAESARMLDEVARRVAAGARIVAITGYASPEDNRERPTPNEQLSLSRAQRLRERLASKLGSGAQLPAAAGGGELLGRVATIAPGSRLADAILDTGFGDPEDVTSFLIGDDIGNPKLAAQFLALLERVTEPADRLRLFGVDAASPAAPRLHVAIEQFIRTRGRGPRPWEGVFGFLRYATVELSTTRQVPGTEHKRTTGSLTAMDDTACQPYALQAEREGLFGPAAPEPQTEAGCPGGEPRNIERFARKCDYR